MRLQYGLLYTVPCGFARNDHREDAPLLITTSLIRFSEDEKTSNKPAPRDIKIQSKLKNSLKIDFDIDLGLLMNSIPNRDDIDEDTVAWDWEQQFSQLAAEFITSKDS